MYPPLSAVNKTERLLPTCRRFLPPAIGLFGRFSFQNRCSRANEPEPCRVGICRLYILFSLFFTVCHDSAKRVTCRLPGTVFVLCDRYVHTDEPPSRLLPPSPIFTLKYKTPTTSVTTIHILIVWFCRYSDTDSLPPQTCSPPTYGKPSHREKTSRPSFGMESWRR